MARKRSDQAFVDKAYITFLMWQCEAAIQALDYARNRSDIARRISDTIRQPTFYQQQEAFSAFQSGITFAGNVAKMLWPVPRGKAEAALAMPRARRLRRLLKVKRQNPHLIAARRMRNDFEHMDNRLDVWAAQPNRTWLLMHALSGDMAVRHIPAADRFNRYDATSHRFSMVANTINIALLYQALFGVWRSALDANDEVNERLGIAKSRPRPRTHRSVPKSPVTR